MAYLLEHDNYIEQGDICSNLPNCLPSNLISESGSKWENYVSSLKSGEKPAVKLLVYPSPTWGVVLSQTCDIEHPKGDSIIFAELIKYDKYKDIEKLSKGRQETYIKDILRVLRRQPRKHYLPKLFKNGEIYGPWYVIFHTIFFVPVELVTNNINLFWKARLKEPLRDVLKEKISRFFTRLAFEECLFFSNKEIPYYIEVEGRVKEEIMKIRKKCGIQDSNP